MHTHIHRRSMSLFFIVLIFLLQETLVSTDTNDASSDSFDLNGDPRLAGPRPPFPSKPQDWPGLESKMDPKPDYGLTSYKGSGKLEGKVAIITGADSGIGRAVALAFAREGASVVITYLNSIEDAKEIQKVIQSEGHECILIRGDITLEENCEKIVNRTVARFNRIDILVNNAGYRGKAVPNSIEDMDHNRVLYTFKTNIIAIFDLIRYAIPHMPKGSSIINVASYLGYKPLPGILDEAASKASIAAFTKGLAPKLLEKGIRVNAIAPGPVWTPMIVASFSEKTISEFGSNDPMERPAQPREIAPAFVYLATDRDSSFVSGEVLRVTGAKLIG